MEKMMNDPFAEWDEKMFQRIGLLSFISNHIIIVSLLFLFFVWFYCIQWFSVWPIVLGIILSIIGLWVIKELIPILVYGIFYFRSMMRVLTSLDKKFIQDLVGLNLSKKDVLLKIEDHVDKVLYLKKISENDRLKYIYTLIQKYEVQKQIEQEE